jgi:DNA modification methylase
MNAAWVGRDRVYPDNVLYGSPEAKNKHHSAAYPLWLPEWFIKLFTQEGGIVLDPFMGGGTTALAALQLQRYVGIEQCPESVAVAQQRLLNTRGKVSCALASVAQEC